ncbi:hypothetical protein DMENIID0001_140330 [Sergentomyia squamirostris]
MSKTSKGSSSSKRVRTNPVHKWTQNDMIQLLTFLKEKTPIEKPTNILYYQKFLTLHPELNIPNWSLVKQKVANLKSNFTATNVWLNSTGRGVEKDGETIQDYINGKCPYFKDLEEIFGQKKNVSLPQILDSESSMTQFVDFSRRMSQGRCTQQRETPSLLLISELSDDPEDGNNNANVNEWSPANVEATLQNERDFGLINSIDTSTNHEISNNSDARILLTSMNVTSCASPAPSLPDSFEKSAKKPRMQRGSNQMHGYSALIAERTAASDRRLDFDKKKHEDELKCREKQLEIEAEKNLILKKDSEAKNQIELKRIEMEERVRMAEIKYKYGHGYSLDTTDK